MTTASCVALGISISSLLWALWEYYRLTCAWRGYRRQEHARQDSDAEAAWRVVDAQRAQLTELRDRLHQSQMGAALEKAKATPTTFTDAAQALARAVLDGKVEAVFPLIDEVLEYHQHPAAQEGHE